MGAELLDLIQNHFMKFAAIVVGAAIFVYVIIDRVLAATERHSAAKASTRTAEAFEQTRREIAAFVAEGTIDADKATAMLAIRPPNQELLDAVRKDEESSQDPAIKLSEWHAWGGVDQETVEVVVSARQEVNEKSWAEIVEMVIAGMPATEAVQLAKAREASPDADAKTKGQNIAGKGPSMVIGVAVGKRRSKSAPIPAT